MILKNLNACQRDFSSCWIIFAGGYAAEYSQNSAYCAEGCRNSANKKQSQYNWRHNIHCYEIDAKFHNAWLLTIVVSGKSAAHSLDVKATTKSVSFPCFFAYFGFHIWSKDKIKNWHIFFYLDFLHQTTLSCPVRGNPEMA